MSPRLLRRGTQASSSPSFKITPVAEISLVSASTPALRTNHLIKVRARTTTGSTGRLRAALYEGATNRSGDLESAPLTNVLDDYILVVPDAGAAAITSYADLSIRIWGYDNRGNSLVFEIANLKLTLQTPIPTMPFPLGDPNDS